MALRDIGADFEHYRLVEFDKYAVTSYNAIHGTSFEPTDIRNVHGGDLGIVDIMAPLFWWKEFDTYKIGTVSDSCSTMHKLASTPITMDCFEMDDFADSNEESSDYNLYTKKIWTMLILHLEALRKEFIETKDKRYWKELIRLLPESWLQKRTISMSYENVLNMVRQRKNHNLTEWSEKFIEWAHTLPYADELLFI